MKARHPIEYPELPKEFLVPKPGKCLEESSRMDSVYGRARKPEIACRILSLVVRTIPPEEGEYPDDRIRSALLIIIRRILMPNPGVRTVNAILLAFCDEGYLTPCAHSAQSTPHGFILARRGYDLIEHSDE